MSQGTPQQFMRLVRSEVDVYVLASSGRRLATQLGFNHADQTRIEIVILELARNILAHAGTGELELRSIEHQGRHGIEVIASDQGPGIADPELALQDGFSTAHTLGAGLPGVRRLMDEFELTTAPQQGTRVRAVRWLPRRRREL